MCLQQRAGMRNKVGGRAVDDIDDVEVVQVSSDTNFCYFFHSTLDANTACILVYKQPHTDIIHLNSVFDFISETKICQHLCLCSFRALLVRKSKSISNPFYNDSVGIRMYVYKTISVCILLCIIDKKNVPLYTRVFHFEALDLTSEILTISYQMLLMSKYRLVTSVFYGNIRSTRFFPL